MKKITAFLLMFTVGAILLCGCTTVPTSEKAKEKLEALGYLVSIAPFEESAAEAYEDQQVILLNAEKDGQEVLQAYFFRNKKDADRFFEEKKVSLRTNVEAFHKFGYVICRGTSAAVEDFLS